MPALSLWKSSTEDAGKCRQKVIRISGNASKVLGSLFLESTIQTKGWLGTAQNHLFWGVVLFRKVPVKNTINRFVKHCRKLQDDVSEMPVTACKANSSLKLSVETLSVVIPGPLQDLIKLYRILELLLSFITNFWVFSVHRHFLAKLRI